MYLKRSFYITLIIDFVLVTIVFMLCQFIMSAASGWFWYGAIGIWVLTGLVFQKFNFRRFQKTRQALLVMLVVNVASFFILYVFSLYLGIILFFSWKYILLIVALTLLELILYRTYVFFVRKKNPYEIDIQELEPYHGKAKIQLEDVLDTVNPRILSVFEALKNDSDKSFQEWYHCHKDDFGDDFTVFASNDMLSLLEAAKKDYRFIFDASKLNNIRYINRYFIQMNALLPYGGVFIGCCETSVTRKKRIFKTYFWPVNYIFYIFDFIWHRLFSKLYNVRKLYFAITKGQHRVFPYTEILGRLYSCGFEIAQEEYINGLFFFAVVKTNQPYDATRPTYGPFIQMKRTGKNGEIFGVYKFRTMHAYSEYLQPYIYHKNKLKEGGKFADDFRVSSWGHFMRKFWIDELPMLINLLRGQIKIVGVRPLSQHYFSLYTPEMQQLRIKVKPGLLPPFYSGDKPETIEEVQQSEREYIEAYLAHPLKTDWKYFWKIIGNILFKRKRSE